MLGNLLDRYDRKARLAPAMLVALPVALMVGTLGWAVDQVVIGAVVGVLVEFGLPSAMASYTRTLGKRIEPALWESWGGRPTTQLLRHCGSTNPHRLALIHAQLAELVPEVPLPTAADENAEPDDAEQRWEAIVEAARSRLRDQQSSRLLFEEICNYGFHRNMLGLRSVGLRVAVAVSALAGVGAIVQTRTDGAHLLLVFAAVTAGLAAWGWHRLSDDHAHRAALSYAEAFVGAILARRGAGADLERRI